jgi:hypothetical protein
MRRFFIGLVYAIMIAIWLEAIWIVYFTTPTPVMVLDLPR